MYCNVLFDCHSEQETRISLMISINKKDGKKGGKEIQPQPNPTPKPKPKPTQNRTRNQNPVILTSNINICKKYVAILEKEELVNWGSNITPKIQNRNRNRKTWTIL
jgi:hypothetical protein